MALADLATTNVIEQDAQLVWLRADTLQPWRLQRPLVLAAARKIAKDFDPDLIGHFIVSRRKGIDYLLDGQHRWHALVRIMGWGDQNLPCLVYTDLTDQQEAKLFHTQGPGVRRQLSALSDFRVTWSMGDPESRRIVTTVEQSGLEMSWSNSDGNNTIRAVGALQHVARTYGYFTLGTTLAFLRDALGPDYRAYSGAMVMGASAFLAQFGETYDRKYLTAKLSRLGVEAFTRNYGTMKAAMKCSPANAVGRTLLATYNANKRSDRLGEWQEKFSVRRASQ